MKVAISSAAGKDLSRLDESRPSGAGLILEVSLRKEHLRTTILHLQARWV